MVGHAQARRRSACPGRRSRPGRAALGSRPAGRRAPRSCPSVGASSPTARLSKVVFPAPFGPTRPTTRPAGISSVQSVSAQRRPYRLPSPLAVEDGGHAMPSSGADRKVSRKSASMLSSSSPARGALASQRCEVLAQWSVCRQRGVAERLGHEGPDAGPGRHQPVVLELPIGLEHGVGVDGEAGHHLFDGRELVALAAAGPTSGPGAPGGRSAGTARRRSGYPGGTRSPCPPFI